MDFFGETSSKNMPRLLFLECLVLDHETAIRADTSRQKYTVFPRHWYVDATLKCSLCTKTFCFSAVEQKRWYEDLGFYVDSFATKCPECRRNARNGKELRQTYDRKIETALLSQEIEAKKRLVSTIDELCSLVADVPKKIHENRRILGQQIMRLQNPKDPTD